MAFNSCMLVVKQGAFNFYSIDLGTSCSCGFFIHTEINRFIHTRFFSPSNSRVASYEYEIYTERSRLEWESPSTIYQPPSIETAKRLVSLVSPSSRKSRSLLLSRSFSRGVNRNIFHSEEGRLARNIGNYQLKRCIAKTKSPSPPPLGFGM